MIQNWFKTNRIDNKFKEWRHTKRLHHKNWKIFIIIIIRANLSGDDENDSWLELVIAWLKGQFGKNSPRSRDGLRKDLLVRHIWIKIRIKTRTSTVLNDFRNFWYVTSRKWLGLNPPLRSILIFFKIQSTLDKWSLHGTERNGSNYPNGSISGTWMKSKKKRSTYRTSLLSKISGDRGIYEYCNQK